MYDILISCKTIADKPCLLMLNIEIKFNSRFQFSIANTTKKISGKLEILCIRFCINFVSLYVYVYWNPCLFKGSHINLPPFHFENLSTNCMPLSHFKIYSLPFCLEFNEYSERLFRTKCSMYFS